MIDASDAALKAQLLAHEGLRTYLYDDATGKPLKKGDTLQGNLTGGIGYNFSAHGLPTDAIDLLYDRQVRVLLAGIQHALPWAASLSPSRQRVFVDIAYNAGIDGLLKFEKMLAAAAAGDFSTAAAEILNSHLALGRRQRLALLMRTG